MYFKYIFEIRKPIVKYYYTYIFGYVSGDGDHLHMFNM